MRFLPYYILHTFKNQLKKLFKTWVLIFIVACMLLGGIVGAVLGFATDTSDDVPQQQVSDAADVEQPDASEAPASPDELALRNQMIELTVGGLILLVFAYMAFGADKNGSKIFLPADVNLLFAAPLRPQTLLLFRLTTKLGALAFSSVYIIVFLLPNLIQNLALDPWSALAILAVWCLSILIGMLLQVLLYLLVTAYPAAKRALHPVLYGVLLAIAAGYLLCLQRSGGGYLGAAFLFFNAPVSRYLPLWGWLKGVCMFAVEANAAGALICLGASLLGAAALLFVIRHMRADFYEDAMAKSEQTAELLAAAQREDGAGIVRRKKERGARLRRNGLRRGSGANMFFFKTMYNRFRFAKLGFVTKTMVLYLVAAGGVGAIVRFSGGGGGMTVVALVLSAITFFRALGNPLAQDTKIDYFRLIPCSSWAKLFWSMLGGSVSCLLDVLPAMLLGAALVASPLLPAVAWIGFAVSIDFYATAVGSFIGLSVPVSAGKTIKQLVQILFLYFGLLPDVVLIAVGYGLGYASAGIFLSAAVNIALGFLFCALCPLFLDPRADRIRVQK